MSDTFNNFATSTPRLTVTSNNVDSSHESSNGSPTSWRLSQIVSRCRSRITSNGGKDSILCLINLLGNVHVLEKL